MRYFKYIIIIIIQLAILSPASGQKISKANKMIKGYEYAEAIKILKKIVEKDKVEKDEAVLALAYCYRKINNDKRAAYYYAMAMDQDDLDPQVYFNYGQTLRTLERYEQAAVQFRKMAALDPEDKRGAMLADNCDAIQAWLELPDVNDPKNVGSLNTTYSDFSPVFHMHGVVITSDRPKDGAVDDTYLWTGKPYLGLMFASLNGFITPQEPIFANPEVFEEKVNQKFHEGPASFSPDGKTMFFTRTQHERIPKDEDHFRTHLLKMFYSEFDDEKWSQPEAFFLNNDKYSVGHPAYSPDGMQLYFVSDMPGGYGGTDIWVCYNDEYGWSPAENLGPEINTCMDEMFPYIDEEGTLYFSSEGHLGFGGLDIFYSIPSDDEWGEVVNMMRNVNTSYDDFGLSVDHDLGTGLLSSNRPGGFGSDDIYAFELKRKMLTICGKVVDPENNPVAGATVFFLNNTRNEVLILKSDSKGAYCTEVEANTQYTILGKKTAYIDNCLQHDIPEEAINPDDLVLMPYEVDQVFELENIYYDLDKWYIRPDAEPPLDNLVRIMQEHPISIELGSHTDCRASDEYNIDLSQKRAESVIRYIILNGINSARMTAKGYGETLLVNECADGVECTEEQHQMNRRTEFRVTSVGEFGSGWTIEDRYEEGDVISLSQFERDFFNPCAEESLKPRR